MNNADKKRVFGKVVSTATNNIVVEYFNFMAFVFQKTIV
jgi:hypothetical protein